MAPKHNVKVRLDVKIPMRDGIKLSADIYLPQAEGPFPTVLIRDPYNKSSDQRILKARALSSRGYACVIQDMRGRWNSEGDTLPAFYGEGRDGYDTQEWVGHQPWCNGKIGTAGASYLGMVQWQSAPLRNDHLTCMVPRVAPCDYVADAFAPGGAIQLIWAMRVGGAVAVRTGQNAAHLHWHDAFRTLPLVEFDELTGLGLPHWKDWIRQPLDDEYWTALNVADRWADISAPAFTMGGWYDVHVQSAFIFFNGQRQHGPTRASRQSKLIVGPWTHTLSDSPRVGDIDFGFHSMVGLDGLEARWFDYWLKGVDNGIVDEPPPAPVHHGRQRVAR